MKWYQPIATGGPRLTHSADLTLLTVAVILLLGSTALMIADILSAGIAIPLIAIGASLVAVVEVDKRRRSQGSR
jgi:hypothetical protein